MNKLRKKIRIPSFIKHQHKARKAPGEAPGTLKFVGDKKTEEVTIELYDYDSEQYSFHDLSKIDDSKPYLDSPSKTWINIKGLHDIEALKRIWTYFDLHPLIQEDILNTSQRSKIENYQNNIFFVIRMFNYIDEDEDLNVEQVSIVLGSNYVLSFQESDYPVFVPVVERIKKGAFRLRNEGPDYSAYALLDTIVDHYFHVLEKLGDEIEELEEKILENDDSSIPQQIHATRRKLIYFRKSVWPMRDSLNTLIRDESPFINEQNKVFYRDVYDHLVQIIDGVENYRDMVMGLLDMYMSHVSNKMNEVMKVLTIIATIFIPLTFVAGIYGMNFQYMPELSYTWAYPAVWVVMITITIVMILFFRRKDWL
ncbi:magnesium/cobalt transporter CorA [Balneola sp. MJW-20]|uniref:magnesium/cobalt transporter CorA n=1 Tax=Gracilimonas aurantiaca TaxID=3234185 RepID=UPI003466C162